MLVEAIKPTSQKKIKALPLKSSPIGLESGIWNDVEMGADCQKEAKAMEESNVDAKTIVPKNIFRT